MEDSYNLYIVYSTLPLDTVINSLYSYTTSDRQLGPTRKDFSRNTKTGKYLESNRKITLIKDSLYESLVTAGLSVENQYDFLISQYAIREDNYPPKDSIPHLFFPTSINKNCTEKVSPEEDIVLQKMNYLSKMGLFKPDEWKIKKRGLVVFNKSVPVLIRIKAKIILDDPEDNFRVSWCKKRYFYGKESSSS